MEKHGASGRQRSFRSLHLLACSTSPQSQPPFHLHSHHNSASEAHSSIPGFSDLSTHNNVQDRTPTSRQGRLRGWCPPGNLCCTLPHTAPAPPPRRPTLRKTCRLVQSRPWKMAQAVLELGDPSMGAMGYWSRRRRKLAKTGQLADILYHLTDSRRRSHCQRHPWLRC